MIVAVSMKQIINKVLMSVFSTVNAKAKEFVHRLAGAEAKTFVGTIRIRNAKSLKKMVRSASLTTNARDRDSVMTMIIFVKEIQIADSF